jgi:peptidoglycan-N-acetylglucosamine deacetylase
MKDNELSNLKSIADEYQVIKYEILDLENKIHRTNTENSLLKEQIKKQLIDLDTFKSIAYLTFDDGPSHNTLLILGILKKYNVKATFFVNGRNTEPAIRIYKKIIEDGHVLGNHTYSHDYSKIYLSKEEFIKDYLKLEEFIHSHTGVRMNIARFPGGSNNKVSVKFGGNNVTQNIAQELNARGYTYFDWNVDSHDASGVFASPDYIAKTVLQQSKNKKNINILLHDGPSKENTVEALPAIIEGLLEQGFVFRVLTNESSKIQFLN